MTGLQTFALFVGFGFLPFWIGTLIVCAGGLSKQANHDYWMVAPWLMVGGLGASFVTMGIACIVYFAFWASAGDVSQKWEAARAAAGIAVGAVLLFICFRVARHKYHQRRAKAESILALEYTRNHPEVIQLAGGQVEVSQVNSREMSSKAFRYEIEIHTPTPVFAIVDLSRVSGKAAFNLACITPLGPHQRDAFDLQSQSPGKAPVKF